MVRKLRLFINFYNQIRALSSWNVNSCGILVIGDEILKGNVIDTNSSYITRKLYSLGVQVKKITVVGDCVDEISEEIRSFSNKYTYVITTGGIGPTHDDVTFEAVAKAFNEPLVYHPVLVKICSNFFNTSDAKSPCMKLAHVPQSAKLIFGDKELIKLKFPLVNVKNVYVFPGIPQLFQKAFDILSNFCFLSSCTFYKKEIHLQVAETVIVSILNEVVEKFPNVVFGSYPALQNDYWQVRITIECTEKDTVERAYNYLLNTIPEHYIAKNS